MEENNVKITGKIVEEPTYFADCKGRQENLYIDYELCGLASAGCDTDPGTGRTGQERSGIM